MLFRKRWGLHRLGTTNQPPLRRRCPIIRGQERAALPSTPPPPSRPTPAGAATPLLQSSTLLAHSGVRSVRSVGFRSSVTTAQHWWIPRVPRWTMRPCLLTCLYTETETWAIPFPTASSHRAQTVGWAVLLVPPTVRRPSTLVRPLRSTCT